MIRRFALVLICVSCSGGAFAAPGEKPATGPVCLYESRTYSEGAYICIQKSLMQVCTSDGTHAAWKGVPDRDINDRCIAPMTHYPPEPRIHAVRRHGLVRRSQPLLEGSAKCFVFNGRQYCE